MKRMRIEVAQELDAQGDLEEFTWDLLPVVDPQQTRHLDENGLPRIGTPISAGMILVGKLGKSSAFNESEQPSSLEIQGLPFSALQARYGHLWKDGSSYATEELHGTVENAHFEKVNGKLHAIVELARKE